jgi:hypothetical protein
METGLGTPRLGSLRVSSPGGHRLEEFLPALHHDVGGRGELLTGVDDGSSPLTSTARLTGARTFSRAIQLLS